MVELRLNLLYALLYAKDKSMIDFEPIQSERYLQKEMFLMQLEYPFTSLSYNYNYVKDSYVPFSKCLQCDIENEIKDGFICGKYNIFLTPQGVQKAENIWSSLSCPYQQTAIQIKKIYNGMKYKELLAALNDRIQKINQIPNWLK